MADDETKPPEPPVTDVTPPTTPVNVSPDTLPRDSMGRSMANKRGRKPGPQGPNHEKLAPGDASQKLSAEVRKRIPPNANNMTDEAVGKALAGAFAVSGLFGGPHWRLFPDEVKQVGELLGPLARMYGGETLAKWITLLMALPVMAAIFAPRFAIEGMIAKGELKRAETRGPLLMMRAMVTAENTLDLEKQVAEGKSFMEAQMKAAAFQQQHVQMGMAAAAQMTGQDLVTEKVVQIEQPQVPKTGN